MDTAVAVAAMVPCLSPWAARRTVAPSGGDPLTRPHLVTRAFWQHQEMQGSLTDQWPKIGT